MEPQAIAGIIIILIALYTGLKVAKDMLKGLAMIILVIIGTALFVGGTPEIRAIPLVGGLFSPYIPEYPGNTSLTGMVIGAKSFIWDLEVLAANQDSDGTLLVAVKNSGYFGLSNFRVAVDDVEVAVTNPQPEKLENGEIIILDTDYMGSGPVEVSVIAGPASGELVTEV